MGSFSRIAAEVLSEFLGGADKVVAKGSDDLVATSVKANPKSITKGLKNNALDDFGYKVDNPTTSGMDLDYIPKKQKYAEEDSLRGSPASKKLFNQSITAYMGTNNSKPLFLNTEFVSKLKGASDEVPIPGDSKYDSMLSSFKNKGWDPDQEGNKILIGVNHKGEGYILEGNHRAAIAKKMNIPSVKVEVKYWNGAEDVDGIYAPNNIIKEAYAKPDKIVKKGLMARR